VLYGREDGLSKSNEPELLLDPPIALQDEYPLKRFKRVPWTGERRRDRFREVKQRLRATRRRETQQSYLI